MCVVCEKELYFENDEFSMSDEAPLAKHVKHDVNSFICPACGKLNPSAIKLFGSKQKALMYLMIVNMSDDMTDLDYDKQFKEVLRVSKLNRFEKVLEQNGLRFENGKVIHKCGHTLLSGIKDIDRDYSMVSKIEGILREKSTNFCPCCGDKLVPFNKDLDMKPAEVMYSPL